ncbi:MAG: hypothetical protein HZA90_21320 [Verrucomicrobia bacterium]|nr:hypothetical protein [Verrucomicrobiota bacterium]
MTSRRLRSASRLAAVALMLALWFTTVLLSASPRLHELLHHDSHSPNHECVVTLLGKGHFLSSPAGVGLVVAEPVWTATPLAAESQVFPSADYRVAPSRAPPFFVLPSTVAG